MASGGATVPRGMSRVFDRYMLPKVAFTMVTLASMAGAVLTGLRHGWADLLPLSLRWASYWMLALLLGTEVWKIFYLRPSVAVRPEAEALDYAEAMLRLHRTWQKVLAPVTAALVGLDLAIHVEMSGLAAPWLAAGGVALAVALAGIAVSHRGAVQAVRQEPGSVVALAGLAGTVAALAGLDVTLQSGSGAWLLIGNRVLHMWAFSAWLGGALWNIFIAVPAGLSRVNLETVILANFQLERFRVVVRMVFPTIVLTGFVQAWILFRWHWQALFTNLFGYLVLAKIGLILALVVVFITCPMWRACSPIRGVCNLDDME